MIVIVSIIIVITILGTFVVHIYINLYVQLHRGVPWWVTYVALYLYLVYTRVRVMR